MRIYVYMYIYNSTRIFSYFSKMKATQTREEYCVSFVLRYIFGIAQFSYLPTYFFSIEYLSLSLFSSRVDTVKGKKRKGNESNRNIVLSSSIIVRQLSRTENGRCLNGQYALCHEKCENKYREIRRVQIFVVVSSLALSNTRYSASFVAFVFFAKSIETKGK